MKNFYAKIITADEAISRIKSEWNVLLPPGCGEPLTLMEALVGQAERFKKLTLMGGLFLTDYKFLDDEYRDNFRYITWHLMPKIRNKLATGMVEFLPIRYFDVIPTFSRGGTWPADAILIHATPPDEHGFMSLGVSVSYPLAIARQAPLVIAEVNDRMPRTLGESFIHVSQVDFMVESSRELADYPSPSIGEIERKIAGFVADLIPDGATLQIGIGSIPEAVLEALSSKKDLAVHAMLIDGMIDLIEKGVITNLRKRMNPGRADVTELMGTKKLFDFVDNNPIVYMQLSSFTHNPRVIAEISNFISVNSAVEVDLTGQVNSESIGDRQLTAIGGQFDFVEGAYWSIGGKSIFAFPSTSGKEGEFSRIVARLGHGAKVTTPRFFTQYVVTEYGVAELKGKSINQRAEQLIKVAHPKFRDQLKSEWESNN